jgi:RimJ/RimL family protein N-acetyltransferase
VQAGTLGYWVGQPHAGKGYMTAALRVLLPTLFGELNLHRIEAACIPTNQSSIRVLEKCGFAREGWRDVTSASMASGRITACMACWMKIFAVNQRHRGQRCAFGSPCLPCYKAVSALFRFNWKQ